MTDKHEEKSEKANYDRTAIIAAGIAIGISLISAPGLYGLTNIPIGLVLIMTLHAIDSRKDGNRFQSATFALAWALAFLVTVGLFVVNPYLTNDQGMFIPDIGRPVTDQFTHIEIPAIGWIKHTFPDGAADIVSFVIVSFVAAFWFAVRRRLYAVHQKPLQPQNEDKGTPSSISSTQSVLPPVQAGQQQVPARQTRSANTSVASKTGLYAEKQDLLTRAKETITLGAFTSAMMLLAYFLNRRKSKHN